MIRLLNVRKSFRLKAGRKIIANGITFDFPAGKAVALLGRNGAGKSSMLNMIAGSMQPDEGEIVISGTISWPVGFAGSFHNDLSGAQNVRFLARIYGIDTRELLDFVADFSELGKHFNQPVRSYSSGMKSRLAFGASMGIHFDTYLVDEVTAVGDSAFREKSEAIFIDRMRHSGAVFVTHSLSSVRRVCDSVAVLEGGGLRYFGNIEEGIARHEANMRKRSDH